METSTGYKIFCLTEGEFATGVMTGPIFPRCPNSVLHQVMSDTLTLVRIYRKDEPILYNIGVVHGGDTGLITNCSRKNPKIGSLVLSADIGSISLQVDDYVKRSIKPTISRLIINDGVKEQNLGYVIGIDDTTSGVTISNPLTSFYPIGSAIYLV